VTEPQLLDDSFELIDHSDRVDRFDLAGELGTDLEVPQDAEFRDQLHAQGGSRLRAARGLRSEWSADPPEVGEAQGVKAQV